ncbi:RNB domain-containing ribonuclease [Actinocrinis puniceicyclus]|uniref:RNB domain-containing ribonuclease n=1 Tax=Actinocrinis puniceicyclus TaxID=977794 RepID=A0A8J8BG23_9ACTN|nr:RNB domain-containing ribonuclease [Actinocrinis puniceicyclus]MBS2965304.1 RNB domain-containing ribonuclease [Actinocrinis puniceicyclus]
MPRRVLVIDSAEAPDEARAALAKGIEAIRAEFALPARFPPEVLRDAERAAREDHGPGPGRPDRTDLPLVTLDPPGSMDLDQAMLIERRGSGFRVWYAIADVAAFVRPDSPLDREARARVETFYLPDLRIPLHPPVLSEGAASLLPGEDRPAVLWQLDLDSSGDLTSVEASRAVVRSRSRLDYPTAQRQLDAGTAPEAMNLLREVGTLLRDREALRGGISLNASVQQVVADHDGWRLEYRAPLPVEDWNAQISLLAGIAAADLMLYGQVGVLRVLPEPGEATVGKLRRVARALKVRWPEGEAYATLIRRMDPARPRHAAFLTEATSLLRGAGYEVFDGQIPPRPIHAALATQYAHVTAPLRRLVDRFAAEICVSLCAGDEVPDWVCAALPSLPALMESGDRRAKAVERACVDLAEAVLLRERIGEVFEGVVLDLNDRVDWDRNGKPDAGVVMLREPAVIARLDGHDLPQGAELRVRLVTADPASRRVLFDWIDAV